MQCRLALGLALGLFRLGCDRNRLRLGLDGRLAALAAINNRSTRARRSGGTFGRAGRHACDRHARLARRPGVHRLHRVAVSCFTPSACTSPMSTARAYFVAVSCFTPSASTLPSTAPPVSRSLLQNARVRILAARSNDAARSSTTPVSTAYFVSRSRALRLRLAHASVHRSAIRVGGVHRYAWHCTE